jgi:hypothetical protein
VSSGPWRHCNRRKSGDLLQGLLQERQNMHAPVAQLDRAPAF